MTPAFKEWQPIVAALRAGRQTIILRKGGIAEGRGGFRPEHPRFWLFPTAFHAQAEKLKTGTWEPTPPSAADTATVTVDTFVELHRPVFLSEWRHVASLDPHHIWSESTVRERFNWSRPAGLHVLIVRVWRLGQPIVLPLTPELAGCRSWIELPLAFPPGPAQPALTDEAFAAAVDALRLA